MADFDRTEGAMRPSCSAGHAPLRRPGSIRRTSSIDVSWPDGTLVSAARLEGRARDLLTRADGSAKVLVEDRYTARVAADRTLLAIEADPPRPGIALLEGAKGGGHLRGRIDEVVPGERAGATPLYLILDDLSGVSLIGGWGWMAWDPDWVAKMRAAQGDNAPRLADRADICTGLATGSSGLAEAPGERDIGTPVPDLRNPDDPPGWHDLPDLPGPTMRRARRIDVWIDGDIHVAAAFQDSARVQSGGRVAVHEYTLGLIADPETLEVRALHAEPRILPFPECPGAVANLKRLEGTTLGAMREKVLAELRGTAGCTHLNDALRALADVPALVERLGG